MGKNILISSNLFAALYKCFVINLENKCEHCIGCAEIKKQLESKGNQIYKRDLYTKSKVAFLPKERETARQKYLEEVGVFPDFRYKKDGSS